MDAVRWVLFLPVRTSLSPSPLPLIPPSTVEPLQTYATALSPWTDTATDPPPPPTRPAKSALVGVVLAGEGAAVGAADDCSGASDDSAGAGPVDEAAADSAGATEDAGAAEDAAAAEEFNGAP